jgi:hypothetical protein
MVVIMINPILKKKRVSYISINKYTVLYLLKYINLGGKIELNKDSSRDNTGKTASNNSQSPNKAKNSVTGTNSYIQPTNVTYKKADKSSKIKFIIIL